MRPRVRSTFHHQRHAVRRCGLPGPPDFPVLLGIPVHPVEGLQSSCRGRSVLQELRSTTSGGAGRPLPLEEGPQFQPCRLLRARQCGSVAPIPHQSLHVLLELKERCSMEDLGLGGDRYVNARKLAEHTRSPLAKNARSPLD